MSISNTSVVETIVDAWFLAFRRYCADCGRDGMNYYTHLNVDNYSDICAVYRPDYTHWFGVDIANIPKDCGFNAAELCDSLDVQMLTAFETWASKELRIGFEADLAQGLDLAEYDFTYCADTGYVNDAVALAFKAYCIALGVEY